MTDFERKERALEGAFNLWLLEQDKIYCTQEERRTLRELFEAMDDEDKEAV